MQKNERNSKPRRATVSTQTAPQQKKSTTSQKKKSTNTKQVNESQTNPSLLDKCISFVKETSSNHVTTKRPQKEKNPEPTEKEAYTQDLLEIRQIRGGMICMNDGTVVGIQEIIPGNFYQKPFSERNFIYDTYKGFFRIAPSKLHFKMRTEKADVNKLISNILAANKDERDKDVLHQMSDYINYINDLQVKDSLCKRFYIIYKYEGDAQGKMSSNINEIYRSMEEMRLNIKSVFAEMGHLTVTPVDVNYYVCEILYKFFNPKTCMKEPFEQRYMRLKEDEEKYNAHLEKEQKKHYHEDDFIAPKGIRIGKNDDYIVMDGMYHTFLTIKDNGHPPLVTTGWTDLLCIGIGYDVDMLAQRLPYDQTKNAIKQFNKISRVYANGKIHNQDKYEDLEKGISNKNYILKKMDDEDEDLWNVLIIITIRANSYQSMLHRKNTLMSTLLSKSIYVEDSFLVAFRNFKMVMPFMHFDKLLFNKNKRNYLSSSMATLYNYTAYELFDDTGIVLGTNLMNGSLVALNHFNTTMYSNANILLCGASGSGKTFTELMFQRRLRLSGHRTFLILPAKGYEYSQGIKNLNGEIINLFPGGKDCINIMQIRPENELDLDAVPEQANIEKASLLAKKTKSIITFLQMLLKEETFTVAEISRINGIITEIYSRFGITDDNDSIYRDKARGHLKEMPILQDLYEALCYDPSLEKATSVLLPFVEGNFQNLNGQTNVCLTNKVIAFDVDKDEIGEDFLAAIMYIAFDCVYDLVKQDMLSMDDVFLDETWRLLENNQCAKKVMDMILLIRGYGGSLILATQDIEPLMASKAGKAIISNTEIKIFLKMKDIQIKAISEVMDLTQEDKFTLRKLKRGYGLIYSNGDRVPIEFKASEIELESFTTDVNVKRRIQNKKNAQKKKNAEM